MKFYLGCYNAAWFKRLDIPLFVSRNRLIDRKSLPQALGTWALDSGGFTEVATHGKWRTNAATYAEQVKWLQGIGNMDWCAPQDYMCEPPIVAKTGLSVETHIALTVQNYLELSQYDIPVIPVLQGWQLDDYIACADLYAQNGVNLTQCDTVGLGSVCRRQATSEIEQITKELHSYGFKLHGFGVKIAGLHKYGQYLKSADSMAWSFGGRMTQDENCDKKNCANCLHYALTWRDKVLRAEA
jgi:hypothetical protein